MALCRDRVVLFCKPMDRSKEIRSETTMTIRGRTAGFFRALGFRLPKADSSPNSSFEWRHEPRKASALTRSRELRLRKGRILAFRFAFQIETCASVVRQAKMQT